MKSVKPFEGITNGSSARIANTASAIRLSERIDEREFTWIRPRSAHSAVCGGRLTTRGRVALAVFANRTTYHLWPFVPPRWATLSDAIIEAVR